MGLKDVGCGLLRGCLEPLEGRSGPPWNLNEPQKSYIQALELYVYFSMVDNTGLRRARRSSVLPTVDNSTRPSASFKGHRKFDFRV